MKKWNIYLYSFNGKRTGKFLKISIDFFGCCHKPRSWDRLLSEVHRVG